ncbi:MAG TPA: hypothetical protein VF232_13220 [Gaiellaceae bacterium]
MAEHELELRLRVVGRELDAHAPTFDAGLLRAAPRRRRTRLVVAMACALALVGVAASPAALSALRHLFDVDEVTELGPLAPGVAAPFAGRSIPVDMLQASAPFRVRTISALGTPEDARVRDDITGGMVTLVYGGGLQLTQWRTSDVSARIAVVPVQGSAEDVTIGDLPALWIGGTSRGTFTLIGADGAVHRESFDVGNGVLLWKDAGMTFLLQGAGSQADALRLASQVDH